MSVTHTFELVCRMHGAEATVNDATISAQTKVGLAVN